MPELVKSVLYVSICIFKYQMIYLNFLGDARVASQVDVSITSIWHWNNCPAFAGSVSAIGDFFGSSRLRHSDALTSFSGCLPAYAALSRVASFFFVFSFSFATLYAISKTAWKPAATCTSLCATFSFFSSSSSHSSKIEASQSCTVCGLFWLPAGVHPVSWPSPLSLAAAENSARLQSTRLAPHHQESKYHLCRKAFRWYEFWWICMYCETYLSSLLDSGYPETVFTPMQPTVKMMMKNTLPLAAMTAMSFLHLIVWPMSNGLTVGRNFYPVCQHMARRAFGDNYSSYQSTYHSIECAFWLPDTSRILLAGVW